MRAPISRTWIMGVLAVLVLVLGAGSAIFLSLKSIENSQHHSDLQLLHQLQRLEVKLARTQVKQAAAQAGSCYRLNVHRAADDRAAYARWRTDSRFASLIVHPPPGSPRQPRAQRAVALGFAKLEEAQAHAEQFAPWTDCKTALEHPSTYSPPPPLPFKAALRRPLYRFELHHSPPSPAKGHY